MRTTKVESWVGTVHLADRGDVWQRGLGDGVLCGIARCGLQARFFLKKSPHANVTCKRCLRSATIKSSEGSKPE